MTDQDIFNSACVDVEEFRFDLDADEIPPQLRTRHTCCPTSHERVEHNLSGLARCSIKYLPRDAGSGYTDLDWEWPVIP